MAPGAPAEGPPAPAEGPPATLGGDGGGTWRGGAGGRRRRRRPAAGGPGAPARLRTKISFGVIVTRTNAATRRPEAVLVRGRYTDEFSEFVHGHYARRNVRAVAALLDAMSVNERLDVYSLNFGQMWYRVWLTAGRPDLYHQKFAKFQGDWMRDDGGDALRGLVRGSRAAARFGEPRWEFPKGRRRSDREADLNCAIRETAEETGIVKRDYRILPGFRRRVSHVHMGVRYVNVYYAAVARRDLDVALDFRDLARAAEVAETRWLDIEQIRLLDSPDRRLESTVAPVFRFVRRRARGAPPPGPGPRPPPRGRQRRRRVAEDADAPAPSPASADAPAPSSTPSPVSAPVPSSAPAAVATSALTPAPSSAPALAPAPPPAQVAAQAPEAGGPWRTPAARRGGAKKGGAR